MKKILFASIGLFAVAMITQLLSAGGQADVTAATGPASNPASQKLVTVDISNPGNVIALRNEIIKHYMNVVSQIPDDAQFITVEQAYAIRILELYRCEEAIPLLAKHIGKYSRDDENMPRVENLGVPVIDPFLNDVASHALVKIGLPTVRFVVRNLNASPSCPISDKQLELLAKITNQILPHFREYFQCEKTYAPIAAEEKYDKFIKYIDIYPVPPEKKRPTSQTQE